MAVDEGIALGFETTPANFTDGKTFPKLWGDLDLAGFLEWIDQTYGDNAYYTPENIALVTQAGKQPCFHSKAETGKHPKHPRQARRKSRKRSKIEAYNGILCLNFNIEHIRVHGLAKVTIECALALSLWNLLILLSKIENRYEDHLSVRKLFGEKRQIMRLN